MWSFISNYVTAVLTKRRWVFLTLPPLALKGAQYLFAPWEPTTTQYWWSFMAGAVVAHIVAWHEEFKLRKELTDTFPRLLLAKEPFDISDFDIYLDIENPQGKVRVITRRYTALGLRLVNRPLVNAKSAFAREVFATVTFTGEKLAAPIVMTGRWSDSPQLGQKDPKADFIASLASPFPIGAQRSLDLVAFCPKQRFCIAVNDESFRDGDLILRDRALTGVVTATIQFDDANVKTIAKVTFDTNGLIPIGKPTLQDMMPK